MLAIGKWNHLNVVREAPQGVYLSDGEEDVLLPNKYIPHDLGESIDVFIYKDSEQRPIATTLTPRAEVGDIKLFEVVHITEVGVFLDWGLEKDLILPFSEQTDELEKGDLIVACVLLDPQTERILATMHIDAFLESGATELKEGEAVNLLIYRITDLGYEVAINQKYKGLIYHNTVFDELDIGMEGTGKIKSIRPDGKIDVHWNVEKEEKQKEILELLRDYNGFMPYHDKSNPEEIRDMFGLSKKEFKRQIGNLYKEKKIRIEKDGIFLV